MTPWPPELQAVVGRVEHLVTTVGTETYLLAKLDQDAADVRDRLDDLGVTITHPDSLLAGLAFMELLIERVPCVYPLRSLAGGARNGVVAALLDHLPLEARP